MITMSITEARANLYTIAKQVNETSEPYLLTNTKGQNCVVLSESDWKAISETLYLNNVAGLTDTVTRIAKQPVTSSVPATQLKF